MRKILNFGSINIDYVYRIPRFLQAGETMSSKSRQIFAGGKGLNQSIALARANANVWHAGRCAADAADMVNLMKTSGVETEFIDTGAKESGHAIIQVTDDGQNCIMLHSGANYEIDETFITKVLNNFAKNDVLVLQNEISNVPFIIDFAHEKGMQIALNPSPIGPQLGEMDLSKITWFLLNEIEGFEITGQKEPAQILDVFMSRYPKSRVVLTLGKQGACYQDENETASHGIYKVPVVDTTAAGDTFTGFFIQAVTQGKTPAEALHIASVASSLAVSKAGAASSIPTMKEVEASM